MLTQLRTIKGLTTYPSKANFLYVELPPETSGKQVRDTLPERFGLIIRECSNKVGSTENYLRVAVRGKKAANKLVEAMDDTLSKVSPHS